MDEISVIENFFKSHQVLFSRPWLESCIDWCKQENLPSEYSLKDLQFNVFEQWLLLDLRDVEVPSLPPNLSSKIKFTLTGNYSLQVMHIVDISKPKYWQIQRIRNGIPKNLDQEAETSRRVLLLTLTDGIQQIEAMELKFIQCLNLNLSPGIKIRLMGPIEVRRGRLMLEAKHVKVFGGEVESLVVENAAENILAKHLKLPLNPTPAVIQESLLTANTDMFSETGVASNVTNASHSNSTRNQITNPQPSQKFSSHQQTFNTMNAGTNNSRNDLRKTSNLATASDSFHNITETRNSNSTTAHLSRDEVDFYEMEEQRMNEEMNILMEVERDFEDTRVKRRKPNKTPDIFDNMEIDDSDFENIVIPEPVVTKISIDNNTSTEFPNESKPVTSENNPGVVDLSDSLKLDNDVFEDSDFDAHLDKIVDKIDKEYNLPGPKIWAIDKLVKNIPNISNGKFKIKAKFKSIVEKMIVVDDEFHLVIKVEDDTSDISVRLHSDIVADFIGFSAVDLMKLKSKVGENDAEAQGKILGGLKGLKEKLIALDKIAEVQVNVREKFPVVLKFL